MGTRKNDSLNTTLRLDGTSGYAHTDSGFTDYPMSRRLWLNAIGGFGNVGTQFPMDLANADSDCCSTQIALVNCFRNPTNAATACIAGGTHPIYATHEPAG